VICYNSRINDCAILGGGERNQGGKWNPVWGITSVLTCCRVLVNKYVNDSLHILCIMLTVSSLLEFNFYANPNQVLPLNYIARTVSETHL
jgi:hypothetical protein